MFRFPWGDFHSLNLGWFLQKFNELRQDWATAEAGIDGALDAEIQKAEDALTDVFAARDAAAASASAANSSALNASQSSLASMDARDQSRAARDAAQQAASNAAGSETAAGNSATAASNSAGAAATSATQAGNSATAAGNSATAAGQSATNAAASETAAGNSATAAAASETAAAGSAREAENAASNVEESAQQIATNTNDIANLKESIDESNLFLGTNIMGYDGGVYYPVVLPTGTTLTMSTADGSTFDQANVNLVFCDANYNDLSNGGWNFYPSANKRTITLVNNGQTAYYVKWTKTPAKAVQLNIGSSVLPYKPYVFPAKYLIDELTDRATAEENNTGVKNLIGNVPNVYYPVVIKKNEYLTVSNGAGINFPNQTEIHFYDSNKNEITYWGLGGQTSRTILYDQNTTSAYAMITSSDFYRQQVMMIKGTKPAPYAPYITGNIASALPDKAVAITEQNSSVIDKLFYAKKLQYDDTVVPFTLLHFSDPHGSSENVKRLIEMNASIAPLIDDMICTGDMVTNTFADGFSWWGDLEGAEKILLCIGNHDVTDGNDYDSYSGTTPSGAYNAYFSPYISNWGVEHTGSLTYYYKDYASKKIRLIVLDYLLTGNDASAQNTWLQTVLADAKTNSYTVVIAEHIPVSDTTYIASNFTMRDKGTVYNQFTADYQASVASFMSGGGKFACYLTGHTHCDAISYNSNYPNQICITVTCAITTGRDNDQYRSKNTKSQDAANVVVIDTETETIKLIRIGADMDCYLRPRNMFTISYADKSIITQS